MKFIFYTNNTFYYLTLVLYLTIIYGMYMQIILGAIQVILFFVLLFNYNKFSRKIKKYLSIYGILTTIYLVLFFGILSSNLIDVASVLPFIIAIILIPMSLGTYFTYIVYQLKKQVL